MTLVNFNPINEFDSLQNTIQKYFDDFSKRSSYENSFSPSIDVSEKGNQLIIEADIPGVKKEDLKITLKDNILTIEGEKKNSVNDDTKYYRIERAFGSFKRSFNLTDEIDSQKIEANFENGVLSIILNKVEEKTPVEKIIKVK